MSIQLHFVEEKTFEKNLEKYRGYTIFTLNNKIFPVKRASLVKKYFDLIRNTYNKIPSVTIVPKTDTLILTVL